MSSPAHAPAPASVAGTRHRHAGARPGVEAVAVGIHVDQPGSPSKASRLLTGALVSGHALRDEAGIELHLVHPGGPADSRQAPTVGAGGKMTSTLVGAAGIRVIVAVRSAPRHRLNTTAARRRPPVSARSTSLDRPSAPTARRSLTARSERGMAGRPRPVGALPVQRETAAEAHLGEAVEVRPAVVLGDRGVAPDHRQIQWADRSSSSPAPGAPGRSHQAVVAHGASGSARASRRRPSRIGFAE